MPNKDRAVPGLPRVPSPAALQPMKLVKLRWNYKNLYAGEIAGFPEEEAEYLLTEKFAKGHQLAGQTYGYAPHEDEHKAIKELQAWQESNTQRAEAEAMRKNAGLFAQAVASAKK